MPFVAKSTLIGGAFAIIVATACCWLPILLVSIGAGAGVLAFVEDIQNYSAYLMIFGGVLLLTGGFQIFNRKRKNTDKHILLTSTLTCPECGHDKEEVMPTDACVYFYDCKHCHQVIKAKEGDCCVFCSYGDVPCPPVQSNENCC